MTIKILPDYMINRLKAWEVVERPASIVKELIENALDAQASHITISLEDGWKQLIQVQDNWTWINHSDANLVLSRYATSKIENEDDLHSLWTYGFRGEALASIAEVSKVTVQTKTAKALAATQIKKHDRDVFVNTVPVPFETWTTIIIEDVFHNVPVRQKYLKSSQTEYFYSYQLFLDFALIHYQLQWTLKKWDRIVFDLKPTATLHERIKEVFKKDWSDHLIDLNLEGDMLSIKWVIWDATLRFWSAENMKFFVNWRPIDDKIIKKAIMKAFERQIVHGEYPLAIIFIDIHPWLVDVNVHPRKTEVKFIDPGAIFNRINTLVSQSLSGNKITSWNSSYGETKRDAFPSYWKFAWTKNRPVQQSFSFYTPWMTTPSSSKLTMDGLGLTVWPTVSMRTSLLDADDGWNNNDGLINTYYKVVWQVWDSYIVLQSTDGLYYVDQHALAERINFEKMKLDAKNNKLTPFPLLQPLSVDILSCADPESKCEQLNSLGFDCDMITETKVAIHAVPRLFSDYKIDIEKLLDKVFPMETINFDALLDLIFAMRACRLSIKSWDRLAMEQMKQLINDGFEHIDGMFVCQHGRPFFVKVDKGTVEKMFNRH